MTVCCCVQPFCGTASIAKWGEGENFKWIDFGQQGTQFVPIAHIPFFNLTGGEPMDPKDIRGFKEASSQEKLIVVMNNAQNNRAIEYLALWLADIDEKLKTK